MTAPPPDVVAAFGADPRTAERLAGGRGLTWRFGEVVLRPSGGAAESEWKAGVLAALAPSPDFAVPTPIRASDGAWLRSGWEAAAFVPGRADETRVGDVVAAGAAFRAALVGVARPDFLDHEQDAWSRADRIVWADAATTSTPSRGGRPNGPGPAEAFEAGGLTGELLAARTPVAASPGLIHGDLLGNVLFAPGRPPTVIDWAPYWRPPGTDAAIAVVDAVCWHGVGLAMLTADHGHADWPALLVRALAFRVVTLHLLGAWDEVQEARHAPVAAAVLNLARPAG